jgi:23S rRNA (pseudouridine1915-N3)-methyltransferase
MEVTLLAVGKLRPAYREACDDYLRRLGRHQTIVEREVREAGRAGSVERQRAEEAERLLKHVSPAMHVVLLDLDGRRWTSEQVAERLDGWRTAARDVAVIIGGAVGVDATIAARANETWSLGPLTLPHELARVVVTEQLYRAMTILRGEPYHKGDR